MSKTAVEQIMGRMLLDVEFRNLMTSDTEKALEGFDLTDEEREGFNNAEFDELNQAVTGLDERVSKWWNNGSYLVWTGGW